ncbi:hypothetical protein GT347_07710 [Xylophilus rhododendri]|uniref:Uncharacterized protein n=1 Tax=Xylophilus rhododendri TaxID=2697032 RepID=A0A857J1W0_9BURK|nr:hypothetical protein [Xylophilus rhododendri]QHI97890.1 hypothetical protein GT347_07710 [Xylophilus rhododendri]
MLQASAIALAATTAALPIAHAAGLLQAAPAWRGRHADALPRIGRELATLLSPATADAQDQVFTLPPEVNHNVPVHDHRYMTMPLLDLLTEVGRRALGDGPQDAVPPLNPDVPAETRRLGDMRYALAFQPGREHDARLLQNAGRALDDFWHYLRILRSEVYDSRPDLGPVIGPWIGELIHDAVVQALRLPLGEDGEAQYDPRLYAAINEAVLRPLPDYLRELDARLYTQARAAFQKDMDRYLQKLAQKRGRPQPAGRIVLDRDRRAVHRRAAPPGVDASVADARQGSAAYTLPTPVNHNVPVHDRRYMTMVLESLLQEVGQRALGGGPPDAVPPENPGVPAERRRLGDMVYALGFQPGREHDTQVLRNAARALEDFWPVLAGLRDRVLARRPELAPVVGPWVERLAKAAIDSALEQPLGGDGRARTFASLDEAAMAAVEQPVEHYLPDLEWRLLVLEQDRLAQELDAFFERISRPTVPGTPLVNTVVGARKNLVSGIGLAGLLSGDIVFVCSEEELVRNLRTIPAGVVHTVAPSAARMPGMMRPRLTIAYPWRRSGTTIDEVYWRDAAGMRRRVLVGLRQGVHSFLVQDWSGWKPTGANGARALDDMRAEAWRAFLALRWHEQIQARGRGFGWPELDLQPLVLGGGDNYDE